jgi:hypothetical protein
MLDSPIVQDIARFFGDYNTVGLKLPSQSTPETATLFAGELKMGVNGVFVIAAPSEQPDIDTGIVYQTLDFWARNKDTAKAYDHLSEVYNFFDRRHHYSTDHYYIHLSHNLGQIEDMDKDVEGAKLLKLSVRFIMMNSQALS